LPKSTVAFRAGENRFSVVAMAKPTLHKELAPISADYGDVVIDGRRASTT
jgi:hypothetical protein